MALIYRTTGAWGAGKGSNLTAPEIDGNFHHLALAIQDLIDNPPVGRQLVGITQEGIRLKVNFDDGSWITFLLPVLSWHNRGEWQPDTAYEANDLFYRPGEASFLVLQDHTSPSSWNPAFTVTIGTPPDDEEFPVYQPQFPAYDGVYFDLAASVAGILPGGQVNLLIYVNDQQNLFLQESAPGTAYLMTPVTDELVFTVSLGGIDVGTITFTPGLNVDSFGGQRGTWAYISPQIEVSSATPLTIKSPVGTDATAKDLAIMMRVFNYILTA